MLPDRAGGNTKHRRNHERERLPDTGPHGRPNMLTMLGARPCAVNMAAMLGARFTALTGPGPLARSNVSAAAVASGGAQMAIRSHDA